MMTAQAIIGAIHAARYTGTKNGLSNTQALLERLGIAPDTVPAIHVAGTNGKGSVCAMLESALRISGRKTGLYTSPFLQTYNERIAINGQAISDEMLEKYGPRVLKAAEDVGATAFELGTALALLIFKEEKVDIAIMEVGLGGRLDPTNVILPRLCVITAIGLDHMAILGDTVEKIAFEKAGIIKPHVPVIVQPCADSVYEVFKAAAAEKAAPITRLFESGVRLIEGTLHGSRAELDGISVWVPLPGAHQCVNALAAVTALKAFGLSDEAIEAGIAKTTWPGRLEWCGNILIDGAHNAHGAKTLRAYVETFLKDKKRVLVTGVISDKLTDDMVAELRGIADTVLTVTPNNLRAIEGETLGAYFSGSRSMASVAEAIREAQRLAGEDGVVVIGGSLYLAGEARDFLGLKHR